MSGPSKVVVIDPEPRAGRQIQLGFEREGVPTVVRAELELARDDDPALVLIGGTDGVGLETVKGARARLDELGLDIPIMFAGSGVARPLLEAAGADEIVTRPAYLRDLVTIGRLLRGVPAKRRGHIIGSLVETTGVYTLVRALASLGRSATLTLIRGLRRGEIRFYHGEVTSAQVGLIHGQAALHQLLLWTDARFDFSHEDVVRRHQIPLSPEELFADAERFLQGVRDSAGRLSPATVLEQDVQRVHNLGKQIPTEVHGVLRMFDGHRVLADILEDSPYRVFETLRVTQKAIEVGLLKPVESQRPKSTWRAVLAIEEWLVGNETRDAVVERTADFDSAPVSKGTPKPAGSRKKRKKRRAATPPAGIPAVKAEIDWGALVPRVIGAEVGPLSGVVPAAGTHGEIDPATRGRSGGPAREGLEALMDTDKRHKIFPTEIGLEPTVVVRGEETDEWERVEWAAKGKAKAEAEETAARAGQAERDDAERKARDRERAEAERTEREAAQRERDAIQATVREAVERMRLERVAADAKAHDDQARRLAGDAARDHTGRAETRRQEDQATAADRAAAQMIAVPSSPPLPTDAASAVAAASDGASPLRERTKPGTDATDLVKRLVAEAVPTVDASLRTTDPSAAVVTASPTVTVSETAITRPIVKPGPVEDEPSDGIVRAMIATLDTARVARNRRAPSAPLTDGPPIKETSGEIGPRPPTTPTKRAEPEPAILVADLGAVHVAVAAAASSGAPKMPDAASPSRELAVNELRKDAVSFSDTEEAFFKRADTTQRAARAAPQESFEDLDEGYEPPKFWDRVFGRKRTKTTPPRKP